MKSIAPNLFVSDINSTISFYQQLGFELTMQVPEQGDMVWAMMTCGDVTFMFQTMESLNHELPAIARTPGGSLLFYIQVKDIRALHARIKDKVTLLKDLEKTFYGATEFSLADNNGFVLTFAEDE